AQANFHKIHCKQLPVDSLSSASSDSSSDSNASSSPSPSESDAESVKSPPPSPPFNLQTKLNPNEPKQSHLNAGLKSQINEYTRICQDIIAEKGLEQLLKNESGFYSSNKKASAWPIALEDLPDLPLYSDDILLSDPETPKPPPRTDTLRPSKKELAIQSLKHEISAVVSEMQFSEWIRVRKRQRTHESEMEEQYTEKLSEREKRRVVDDVYQTVEDLGKCLKMIRREASDMYFEEKGGDPESKPGTIDYNAILNCAGVIGMPDSVIHNTRMRVEKFLKPAMVNTTRNIPVVEIPDLPPSEIIPERRAQEFNRRVYLAEDYFID
ncbi:hypothetical protein HK098_001800, partial [Nowakowskiella sp. JEL0407]